MNNLKLIESKQNFVNVYETDTGEKVVNARQLWEVLESKQDFSTWIKKRLNECDAYENVDYIRFHKKMEANNATLIEYILKLNTAKEMSMLEKNKKGKEIRRYFIEVEEKYKNILLSKYKIPFKEQVECIGIIADMLRVNDASKVLMLNKLYESNSLPTEFLPQYVSNGNRTLKSATELLKVFNLGMNAKNFNVLLRRNGFLEERTRLSTKGDEKKFNALTEEGLKYGENLINPFNQKEVQPMYYADTFQDLFKQVV